MTAFSVSVEIAKADRTRGAIPLGHAHYSYAMLCRKFCDMFDHLGHRWEELSHPEIYTRDNLKYRDVEYGKNPTHIAFKPPEHLRVAKGYRNIAYIAWEFDKFPHPWAIKPVLPMNDYLRGLRAFDQVWVGCSFTRDVLRRAGIEKAQLVPAPIALPAESEMRDFKTTECQDVSCRPFSVRNHRFSFLDSAVGMEEISLSRLLETVRRSPQGRAFVVMANPHDRRKNLAKIIRAFAAFHHDHPQSVLIIKMTCSENLSDLKRHVLGNVLFPEVPALDARGVYFTQDFISEKEKSTFFRLFDFYICASRSEGQNLPLQEAMAAGVVPISVSNTAMADYISAENSFIIPSYPSTVGPLDNPEASQWGLGWNDSRELEMTEIFHKAAMAPAAEVSAKRQNALKTIAMKYSYGSVDEYIRLALA